VPRVGILRLESRYLSYLNEFRNLKGYFKRFFVFVECFLISFEITVLKVNSTRPRLLPVRFRFRFIIVYLKLNGAFWANCTIFIRGNKSKLVWKKRRICNIGE